MRRIRPIVIAASALILAMPPAIVYASTSDPTNDPPADEIIADDLQKTMEDITPGSEKEVAAVPRQSAELTQSYGIVTGRADGFRTGDAFVSVVQTDPARNRLIVGIDGAGKEAAQVAKAVRQSLKEARLNGRVKLKFSKGAAAAADSAATESSSPLLRGDPL
ncbi:hypothetical protein [Mobilicoccus caccae]|uniref:Uncharacterized protein n=1 Tax=Mobilicoccus caccae TaxID=1859295 RepID=A0ABQ6IKA3_9MICO|nr:hypothetical protein [Mobilicoccus caccae]GMA38352.1 hypothetical protein GCM10025883_03970 [Mobilicoccus caccae]